MHNPRPHTKPAPDKQASPPASHPRDLLAVRGGSSDPSLRDHLPAHSFLSVDAEVWVRSEPPGLLAAVPSRATALIHHPTPSVPFSLDRRGGSHGLELAATPSRARCAVLRRLVCACRWGRLSECWALAFCLCHLG